MRQTMLFAQDYIDGQLPYKKTDKIMMFKVGLSAIFLALSIFMFLISKDSFIGVLVLFCGLVWNLYTPLNNFYSVVLSIVMGVIYALVCYGIGLVANAFLYLAYYVPMQFLASQNKGETFIFKNKTLTKQQSVFVLFYYILFFIGIYAFSKNVYNSSMCLLDSLSATLLAVSALARNLRIKDYYKIRITALLVSILMWMAIASGTVMYPGAVSVVLMYIMYFIHDAVMCMYEKTAYNSLELEKLKEHAQIKNQQKADLKKQEYAKMLERDL